MSLGCGWGDERSLLKGDVPQFLHRFRALVESVYGTSALSLRRRGLTRENRLGKPWICVDLRLRLNADDYFLDSARFQIGSRLCSWSDVRLGAQMGHMIVNHQDKHQDQG